MSKDKTTMNTEDKGLNNSVSNGNQSTSSQAQSERDYENLINKSLDEQITDVSVSRADITNPNLHYGIEEEAVKIDDFTPEASKKDSKLLSDVEKPLTETTERQTINQDQTQIEELQTKETVGSNVPQAPGELASPNTPKGTETPSKITEGETTPENTTGNNDDPDEETGTPGGTTSAEETETFNPDLITAGNSVDENAAEGTVIATLNLEDADGSVFTYYISDASGAPVSNSNFNIVGNELVVSDTANLDFESLTSHNIFITAIDGGGNRVTEPFTININDVDEFDVSPITDTDATANSVTENAAIGTSVGITAFASDADGSNNGITYSLSDDAGGLFAIDPNTGEVTVAGSIDYETATSQTIEVTATSEDGSTSTQSFTINVTDVDEFDVSAITDTDATTNSVAENASIGTSVGITAFASDADGSNNGITYSLSDDAGGLFAIDPNTGEVTVAGSIDYETATSQIIEVTATSDDGSTSTQSFTINVTDIDEFDVSAITDTDGTTNTVAENASIGTSVGITAFASDADGSNNGITYSLSDDAGGLFAIDPNTGEVTVAGSIDYETATSQIIEVTATSEDGSTSTQSFTINVTDIDEFDVSTITDTNTDANEVDEDASVGTTVGITALATDADGTDTVTYSLSDDAGGLFSIDANTGVVTVASGLDAETATSHNITVVATSTDGSTSNETFTINVNDVNETSISAITDNNSSANSVSEGASVGTAVGITALATDADVTDTVTYSLSSNPGGFFAIDANTGVVTVASGLDFEINEDHTIEVTATSSDGTTSTETFTIDVTDVDEFDVSAITDTDATTNSVAENSAIGTSVGITAFASDADGSNNGITYSLSDDAGGLFAIDPNTGEVTVAGAIDYETATSQTIEVTATSEDGSTSTQSFTINITDVDEYDVSAISDTNTDTNVVDEDASVGAVVGITALATDADGTDTVTYSLSDDAGGLFTIDANTGVVTVANGLDAETATSHNITVVATSTDGSTSNETFTINVNDVNETSISAITDNDSSANSVAENASVGTAVGITALATDADVTDTVTYSLSSNPGGFFAIDANTGVVTVASGLDFETNEDHTIEVTATSSDGTTSTETFTIDVTDVDEFDVSAITDTDATTNSVNENASIGTSVGITAFASDADGSNNDITYSLSDDAGGLFAIDPNTGEVTVAGSIDYETATSQTIEVTATSEDGSTSTQTFTVNIENTNEGPTDITFTGGTVNETVEDGGTIGAAYDPSGTTVATLSTTDEDAGETFTYAITNDPSGHFEIVDNEVRVKAGQTIDYETATSHDITIEVTDSSGATYSETITINVEDYEGSYTGANNADTHTGTSEEDTVSTGGGSDTIIGSDGADSIDGGTGKDTVDYSGSTEGVTVNFETGQGTGGQAEGDTYTNVENVIGTDYNDNIKGSYSGTQADLGAGDDIFDNTQGYTNQHDVIDAGAGNDTVYTGDGNDTIDGDTGNDQLYGEGGDDTITGGAGDDTILGGTGTDTVTYSGNWSDYTITLSGGFYTITDNRPGSPDGTDTVSTDVENFQFADATVPQADILNDAPTDITVSGGNIDENGADGTVVATLGVTDADSFIPSETATYSITNDPSGNFEIVGNEVRLKAGSSLDFETDTTHDITVQVTDVHGATYSETITINVNDIDEFDVSAITDTNTDANAVDEDASVGSIVGITALATDADGSNNSVTYSLSDDAGGLFSIDANTGVVTVASGLDAETATSHNITVVATSSDGSTSNETFTINVNDVNETSISTITDNDNSANSVAESAAIGTAVGITALATDADVTDTVTYSLSSNPGGFFAIDANTGVVTVASGLDFETNEDHTIEVTATSSDGTTSTETFTIDVTDDTSEASVSAITDTDSSANIVAENVSVGTSVGITAFASDADVSDNVTYSLSDDAGGLFAIDPNTGEVTVAGSIDYETATSQTIEVTATSDDGSTSTQSFTINITDVDEFDVSAITDTDATTNSVAENAAIGTSVGITAFASDADGSNNGITYTLSDDAGGLFAIDPNTGEVTVAGAIDYETATSQTIEVTATSEDGSTSTQSFTINVNDVNETSISAISDTDSSANSVSEGAAVGTSVGITAFATDADVSDNVTYSLSDDAGGLFAIDPNTGEVTVAGAIDYETATSQTIEVTATSDDGSTSTQNFTININDVDEFDVSAITDTDATTNSVAENATIGTSVGITAFASDADGSNNGVTYSLSDDAGGLFAIDPNTGEVTVAGSIDYETATSQTIEVTATSEDGSTSTQSFTINIDDINESGISAITDTNTDANEVDEDASVGAVVGITALATDADGTDTATYSLSDDAGGLFTIDANTGVVTVANGLDAETATSHNITVVATSTDGSTSNETFTINVNDVNETSISAITDSDSAANSVSESASVGTAVGITALATDADVTDTVTYSLSSNPGGFFAIDANTGVVTVASGLDFETNEDHTIEVTATSSDGTTSTETFTIDVTDVDEFDVSAITDTDATTNSVDENSAVGTSVGITAFASDADGSNNGVTYSLSDDAGGLFAIDPNTGEVTVAGSIDYETATSQTIEVTATSDDGSTSTQSFTININDINESGVSAITDTNTDANAVDEDASVGAVVGITALATDADGTDTVTYSLSDDAGGLFSIDANTGVVTVASGLDAETATSHNITVVATSTDGSTSNETFTINVNDVNETSISAITDNDSSANSVAESASVGTAVGITALATDADVTDTVTYSLSSNPGGFFAIDANTGVVTVASGLDFEINEDHTIEVTATSSDGTTSTETFTIDVTDVDEFDVSAITDIDSTANSVNENASIGTSVGITAFASDADGSNNGVTYSLSDDAGGLFAIDPNTGEVTVAGAIDYETATSQTIEVTATSEDGSTSTQSFTINVNDLNEAPVAQTVDLGATNEDTGILITEAQLLANSSDVDAGTTLSITALTLQDNAHGSLTDNGNGTWTFNPTGDLSVNDVTFNFTVSDGTLTDSSTATLDITAVADAPTLDLSTTSQDLISGSTTIESGFEGDVASIGATGNNGFVGSIGGWMTDSDAIEVKTETLGDGSTNQFIELNNDALDFYEDASNIYQEIDTTDGGTYTVDFNFAPRPGYDATINQIEVLIDGVVVKTISADGTSDGSINWQSDSITFTGDGTPARIEFREAGVDQDYGRGMYMDNIEITEELPAGHANGMENTAIALPDITAATTDTDGSETLALIITNIPDGAVLTDGTNTFTATSGDSDVDISSWQLDNISITPPNEFSGDITLTVNATATDGSDQNTTSSDISITVHDDDDTFTGTATEDLYNGGAGDDTINGNGGNDWLVGGEGEDTINGGFGDDVITGGAGDDEIDGGDGADTAIFSGNLADYDIAVNADGDYLITDLRTDSPDGTDLLSNIESFQFADQTVAVGAMTPTTTFDINEFRSAGDGITQVMDFSTETTDQTISGGSDNELIIGGSGDDTIDAGAGNDDADGRTGKDTISGGDGDDIILGGTGSDTLSGDAGNDAIDGGAGKDTAKYTGNLADYTITTQDDGSFRITDNRAGSPDGTDVVTNVEFFEFADGTYTNSDLSSSDTDATANTVVENASIGTTVGITASATGDVTYSLTDDAGGLFTIDPNTGVVTVAGAIDYETATSHIIEVTATQPDGTTLARTYEIDVNDANEFNITTITDTDATTNSIAENASIGTSVGITALATDADGSDTITYSLSDDAGGLFAIDPNTGEVTVAGSIDYETATSHTIEITATSSDGSTSAQTYTIDVTNVNEAPTDISFVGNDNLSLSSSTPELSGLTHQWKLEGNADDDIGSNDGTVNGATTVSGKDGNALSFDEVNDYATIPDVTMNNEFTVTFQFKLDDNTGSLFQYLYSHGDINSTDSLNIFINEASHGTDPNMLRTVIRDSNDPLDNYALEFDISGIVGDGQWHTYTLTVENGVGSKVYLDGALQNSDTSGGDSFDPSGDVYLGARQDLDPDRYFGGELDTVQIYDRPLTSTEANDLHNVLAKTIDAGTIVADVTSVIDPDSSDTHTFSLTDDASGKFQINSSTGEISLVAKHDASTTYSDTVTVQVTDDGGNTYSETIQINLGTDGSDTIAGGTGTDIIYGFGSESIITGSNLITNGSFEDYSGLNGSGSGYEYYTNLNGWNFTSPYNDVQLYDAGSWSVSGTTGSKYMDMENDGNTTLWQDVSGLTIGTTYQLSFDAAQMSSYDGTLEIYWGGQLIDTIDVTSNAMTTYTYEVVSGAGDGSDRLLFDEKGAIDAGGTALDNVQLYELTAGGDTLSGGAGDDAIYGGTGDDTINGGDGNDILSGGAGADTIDGGTGIDTVDYSGANAGVNVAFQDTDGSGSGGTMYNVSAGGHSGDANGDTFTSIENFVGTDYTDNVFGGSSAMTYDLGAGDDTFDTDGDVVVDTINTGAGNDTVWAGGGDDIITGGAGNDTLSGEDGNDLFIFQEGDGNDTIYGGAGGGWTDTIQLQDELGGSDLGVYGTDWTVTLTEGTIEQTNDDNLIFSDDADGTITLEDGSSINFTDIERIDW